ncbi:hypothetical protein M0R45_003904 [Rubus argutus]|uniref:Uncharacterized protein n=1 Tax=Rubus argutus TaxID=59490 RepID=A0AAW1YGT4_RUBAR
MGVPQGFIGYGLTKGSIWHYRLAVEEDSPKALYGHTLGSGSVEVDSPNGLYGHIRGSGAVEEDSPKALCAMHAYQERWKKTPQRVLYGHTRVSGAVEEDQ